MNTVAELSLVFHKLKAVSCYESDASKKATLDQLAEDVFKVVRYMQDQDSAKVVKK